MNITSQQEQPMKMTMTISNYPDFKALPVGAKKMLLFSEAHFSDQPASPPYECSPSNPSPRGQLTFGDFVAGVYHTWGKRKAKGIVQFAVNMNVVEFCGPRRFVIS
jgi:hypothetical protein